MLKQMIFSKEKQIVDSVLCILKDSELQNKKQKNFDEQKILI